MLELNNIYCGDAETVLKEIDDNSIDMVITSPPYDDLRKYNGIGETWNFDKFKSIAVELKRVLKDGGVIVWIINDKTNNGSETLSSFKQALFFQEIGLNINDTMIWHKTNPMPQVKQPRYNQTFEYMFIISKGKPKTFNPIMTPCKCGGQEYNSTCKNIGGEDGRTKKNFEINKYKVSDNVWNIAVSQNKTKHPAVFPLEIVLKHIQSWSNEGDIILDCFMGSGTTAIGAIQLKRKFIGIEMSEEYCQMAKEIIDKFN